MDMMSKAWLTVFFTILLQPVFSQNNLLLEFTGIAYKDTQQLQDLYLQYDQSMLIVQGQIYLLPCECSPCRNAGGDNEGRNRGGEGDGRNSGKDSDQRNMGGDNDGRNFGGDEDGRNLGGDGDGRNLGGDSDARNQGGDSNNRSLGGENDGRGQGGDNDGRNLGGDADGRNQGGDEEGRNRGGDNDGRNAGADADLRQNGGELSSFSCERKSRNKFELFAINKNAEVYYFDGSELKKVDMSKGMVKL